MSDCLTHQSLISVNSRHEWVMSFNAVLKRKLWYPVVQFQPSVTEVSEELSQFSVINGRLWQATEFGRFCRSEPWNFASWPRGIWPNFSRKTVGPSRPTNNYCSWLNGGEYLFAQRWQDILTLCINCMSCCVVCAGWVLDASSRPSFKELGEEFEKMAMDPSRYLVIEVESNRF